MAVRRPACWLRVRCWWRTHDAEVADLGNVALFLALIAGLCYFLLAQGGY